MNKSIYAVYWRWYDGQGKEILPRTCVTHSWHSSYRKAKAAFDKQKEILYGNYPERKVEHDPVRHGWSTDDGTVIQQDQKRPQFLGAEAHRIMESRRRRLLHRILRHRSHTRYRRITREPRHIPETKIRGTENMYEIVEKKPVVTYSSYHDATTVRIPCYCILPDGREGFLLNVLKDVVEEGKKKNPYVIMCIDAEKKELEYLVEQLKKNNGKWFDRYSRTYQPFEGKGLSPLEFIKWIKDKGYTFDKSMVKLEKEDERTACFHGNLNEYSCAFRYEIFDAGIINEIITSVPGLNILEPET